MSFGKELSTEAVRVWEVGWKVLEQVVLHGV